ncbi:hypothetical protein BC835DRAFT_1309023 [Cytidiella melzeri]|nr:hypothetical protein BC835DRAFT_1309023 [Cytidiella melzeri]
MKADELAQLPLKELHRLAVLSDIDTNLDREELIQQLQVKLPDAFPHGTWSYRAPWPDAHPQMDLTIDTAAMIRESLKMKEDLRELNATRLPYNPLAAAARRRALAQLKKDSSSLGRVMAMNSDRLGNVRKADGTSPPVSALQKDIKALEGAHRLLEGAKLKTDIDDTLRDKLRQIEEMLPAIYNVIKYRRCAEGRKIEIDQHLEYIDAVEQDLASARSEANGESSSSGAARMAVRAHYSCQNMVNDPMSIIAARDPLQHPSGTHISYLGKVKGISLAYVDGGRTRVLLFPSSRLGKRCTPKLQGYNDIQVTQAVQYGLTAFYVVLDNTGQDPLYVKLVHHIKIMVRKAGYSLARGPSHVSRATSRSLEVN